MKPDEVPQEWAEAGGRALYEDTWLPELWPAWEALHEKRREEYRHRFAVTLAAVIPQVKAAALREWIAEWPTTPGKRVLLADIAFDGLHRADAIEADQ